MECGDELLNGTQGRVGWFGNLDIFLSRIKHSEMASSRVAIATIQIMRTVEGSQGSRRGSWYQTSSDG